MSWKHRVRYRNLALRKEKGLYRGFISGGPAGGLNPGPPAPKADTYKIMSHRLMMFWDR